MTNQAHILIVDDEALTRDVLEGYLARDGYKISFAANGFETLGLLEKMTPDVILLDILMPYLNGFEVCQKLKSNKRLQHIPIILVTALGGKEDIARGLDAGADDFLHKPVSALELRTRIRSMLRLKKQYDELESALQFRNRVAQVLADGMRAPITAITGHTSMLHTINKMPPEGLKEARNIYFQAHRLNGLLNNMLMLVKMEESGRLKVNRLPTDIIQLVQQVEADHQTITRLKNISIVNNMPKDAPHVWVDPPLIKRVLDNLISNAIKFSPVKSIVTVCIQYQFRNNNTEEAAPPQLTIQVEDQGPGIPLEKRNHLFNGLDDMKSKQLEAFKEGVGLAFCKIVVESHGGSIFVADNKPVGSIFTIEI